MARLLIHLLFQRPLAIIQRPVIRAQSPVLEGLLYHFLRFYPHRGGEIRVLLA